MVDMKEDVDEDEPFVDVCYISDLLVNLIAGDSQQIGILTPPETTFAEGGGDFIPWSFDLFSLGLDILLPKMTPETFKVELRTPSATGTDVGIRSLDRRRIFLG